MSVIAAPVQALLALFQTELGDLRFADLDAAALEALAAEVEGAAEAVAAKQAELDQAQAVLRERQDLLLLQAQRALAYARVYAENDAELGSKLEAISLPRAPRRPRAEAAPQVQADILPGGDAAGASTDTELEVGSLEAEPARARGNAASRKKKRDAMQPDPA